MLNILSILPVFVLAGRELTINIPETRKNKLYLLRPAGKYDKYLLITAFIQYLQQNRTCLSVQSVFLTVHLTATFKADPDTRSPELIRQLVTFPRTDPLARHYGEPGVGDGALWRPPAQST